MIAPETESLLLASSKQFKFNEWLPILGVLILIALIYSPVITNAFNGDDFVHLRWLAQAVKQPELLWRNFHSAWLDITTAKFYRPLISLFMFADYTVWRGNGIGFHLTNLLCHLMNTLLFWLILRHLSITLGYQPLNYIWCLGSAVLFGLYPLHPEAVSWITGRVDTFVTLFSLASIFSYIRWRDLGQKMSSSIKQNSWLYLSLTFMGLALLCKEMAIILPAVFCWYELTIKRSQSAKQNLSTTCLSVVKNTSLFWLLLFFYFVLRYFSLGTLIGGYDNSVLSLGNLPVWLSNWRRSLSLLLFPFNADLVNKHNSVMYLWAGLLSLNFILIGKQVLIEKRNTAIFLFLFGCLVLTLVPVYKLFNIAPDLQGSRLAYLATVPLCGLLCLGYAGVSEYTSKIPYWRLIALTVLTSAAGAGLLVNNSAWLKAEATSRAITEQLNILAKTIPDDSVIYIVGLPDQINGAYICRNALDGMSKYPQVSKDIRYCFNLDDVNHVFPFGYARKSMVASANSLSPQLFVWDSALQELKRFCLPNANSVQFSSIDKQDIHKQNSQVLVDLHNRACFDIDCLKVKIKVQPFVQKNSLPPVVNLFYADTLSPQFIPTHRIDALLSNAAEQELVFPLRGQVDWALGGKSTGVKLVFPRAIQFEIEDVTAKSASQILPILTFQPTVNQNQLGFIELSASHPSCELQYDVSKIAGVGKIMLELTPADQTFTVANDASSPFYSWKNLKGAKGLLLLKKDDFSGPGIYELRLRVLTNDDKPVGIAGDHIVVTVK